MNQILDAERNKLREEDRLRREEEERIKKENEEKNKLENEEKQRLISCANTHGSPVNTARCSRLPPLVPWLP